MTKRIYPKETRQCKTCQKEFSYTQRKTNSRGTYCSVLCRNEGYAKPKRTNPVGYRKRWKAVREQFIKLNNFCSYCGTKDSKLEVHHIVPYCLEENNSPENLVTLCHKHHSFLEKFSHKMKHECQDLMHARAIGAYIAAQLQDKWMLYANHHSNSAN